MESEFDSQVAQYTEWSGDLNGDVALLPQLPAGLRQAKAQELQTQLQALATLLAALSAGVPDAPDPEAAARSVANFHRDFAWLEQQLRVAGQAEPDSPKPPPRRVRDNVEPDAEDDEDLENGGELVKLKAATDSKVKKAKVSFAAMQSDADGIVDEIADHRDHQRAIRREIVEGDAQCQRSLELVRLVRRGRLLNALLVVAGTFLLALTVALLHWYHEARA